MRIERCGRRQRERLALLRVDRERAADELGRLAREPLALGHRQRIGVVRKQGRIIRDKGVGSRVGIGRLRVAPQGDVRTRQQHPALGFVGVGLQPLGEVVDHGGDLAVGKVVAAIRVLRRDNARRAGVAEPRVQDERGRWKQQQQRQRHDRSLASPAGARRRRDRRREFIAQPPRQLAHRLVAIGGRDDSVVALGVEHLLLVAIDRDRCSLRVRCRSERARAQQRPQQRQDR